ncbi:MAG: aromatic ring-hydroxylating dioxygenase subunit alpha [Ilumatobacteraceae bacterium]|nr:aromatic ring-hydroxylating dioxygenase subunit alpha [Ilumatobacteraceae bacterium]
MTSISNLSAELKSVWHPIGRADSFGETPTRIELVGEAYVVVRLGGEIKVFADICPHRYARLSDGQVVGSNIQCPYHGWQYDANGRCAHVPALGSEATLPPAQLTIPFVQEKYDLVWVSLLEPIIDILQIPEWEDESLTRVWMPPIDINAGAAQSIDNFLDFAHFPFVHAGTFGSEKDLLVNEYSTERTQDGWGFVVEYPHVIENHEDPLVKTGAHPLIQDRLMRYDFRAPFTANLRLELPLTGMVNAIVMWCQPMTLDTTRVHIVMIRNDCHTPKDIQDAIDYEMKIFTEDLKVIEFLADKTVPLDRGQSHVRSDRHTVEFRRILLKLLTSSSAS